MMASQDVAARSVVVSQHDNQSLPASMRRLQLLKEKIQQELAEESRARQEEASKEPVIPISLAADYAPQVVLPSSSGSPSKKGTSRPHGTLRSTASTMAGTTGSKHGGGAIAAATSSSAAPPVDPNDPAYIIAQAKEKIAGMKLERWVQRTLEAELDQQAVETAQLKAHNARLRGIITLRQESNARREHSLRDEVDRLNTLCDEACVDMTDMDQTMSNLRSMNSAIQQGAEQLKATIGEQADTERLQLIRNYRVKIREVKQMLQEQAQRNLEGAKVWIERHRVLETDRNRAAEALAQLEMHNERLEVQNRELEVMLKHQGEQRDALTSRVAVVKRENKRLTEHIATLEKELEGLGPSTRDAESSAPRDEGDHNESRHAIGGHTHTSLTAPTASSAARNSSKAVQGVTSLRSRAQDRFEASRTATQHAEVLKKLRRALETIRTRLKEVRSAHVELLQERTELEVFMRQCMEDVRKDMYRFTVVTNAGKARGDGTERVLDNYTTAEKRQLLAVLQSKLRVFATLHAHMFPANHEVTDGLDVATRDEYGLAPDDERAIEQALGATAAAERRRAHALAAGHSAFTTETVEHDSVVEAAVDSLWKKWKMWTNAQ